MLIVVLLVVHFPMVLGGYDYCHRHGHRLLSRVLSPASTSTTPIMMHNNNNTTKQPKQQVWFFVGKVVIICCCHCLLTLVILYTSHMHKEFHKLLTLWWTISVSPTATIATVAAGTGRWLMLLLLLTTIVALQTIVMILLQDRLFRYTEDRLDKKNNSVTSLWWLTAQHLLWISSSYSLALCGYVVYFYFYFTHMTGMLQMIVYFGYMSMFVCAIGLICVCVSSVVWLYYGYFCCCSLLLLRNSVWVSHSSTTTSEIKIKNE